MVLRDKSVLPVTKTMHLVCVGSLSTYYFKYFQKCFLHHYIIFIVGHEIAGTVNQIDTDCKDSEYSKCSYDLPL